MRWNPHKLSWRWKDLNLDWLKYFLMMRLTKTCLWCTRKAFPQGSHETMYSCPTSATSSSIRCSFCGKRWTAIFEQKSLFYGSNPCTVERVCWFGHVRTYFTVGHLVEMINCKYSVLFDSVLLIVRWEKRTFFAMSTGIRSFNQEYCTVLDVPPWKQLLRIGMYSYVIMMTIEEI